MRLYFAAWVGLNSFPYRYKFVGRPLISNRAPPRRSPIRIYNVHSLYAHSRHLSPGHNAETRRLMYAAEADSEGISRLVALTVVAAELYHRRLPRLVLLLLGWLVVGG